MIQQHYYPYGYYPYNMEPSFGTVPLVQDDKIKEERLKESPSPADQHGPSGMGVGVPPKPPAPIPNPIQVPTPNKVRAFTFFTFLTLPCTVDDRKPLAFLLRGLCHQVKSEPKHQPPNENHQILKESIEIKSQMSAGPYNMYPRPHQPVPQQSHVQQQREEDMRRFYLYSDQRRKEQQVRDSLARFAFTLKNHPSSNLTSLFTREFSFYSKFCW